jgi:hypothetical protein
MNRLLDRLLLKEMGRREGGSADAENRAQRMPNVFATNMMV